MIGYKILHKSYAVKNLSKINFLNLLIPNHVLPLMYQVYIFLHILDIVAIHHVL